MSNTFNHIQETETIQSFSQQPKKYWQYVYELRHIPTGLLYVGSRSNQSVLKKFEDCYTDKYLGSSSLKEGPFSKKDTKANPQDYAKTVLKVFYDEDPKEATKYEQGSNGLIMTYWNLYGKDKVLNQHCILNDGSKVFSNAGQNPYANKTIEELEEISQKQSDSLKKVWENKPEEEKKQRNKNISNSYINRTPEQKEKTKQKKSKALKGKNKGKKHTQETKDKWSIKRSGEKNPMFGQGHKLSGEKNGMFGKTHTQETKDKISAKLSGENSGSHNQYIHPYNHEFKGNANQIAIDIRKNYPNEIPWNQIPRKKRNELIIN